MQSVLQKIDRIHKPIKKNSKIVDESLIKKGIFLEQDNFDILQLLQTKSPMIGKTNLRKKELSDETLKQATGRKRRRPN